MSLSRDNTGSWVGISHWSNKFCDRFEQRHRNSWRSARRSSVTAGCKRFGESISGKSKITKRRTCCFFIKNHSYGKEELDWYWTREIISLNTKFRRKWFIFFVVQRVHREEDGAVHFWIMKENLRNPFPQSVHWSDGRWKVFLGLGGGDEKEIPVLFWCFRISCLFPSSLGTFGTQSYWSLFTGQCDDSEELLPVLLPCRLFCLLILVTKVTRILTRFTWMSHVVHKTYTIHGKDIKTRYIWSTSTLQLRRDWHSIRLDWMQSTFKKRFQLKYSKKLLDWKLEKSYTKK